MMHQPEGDPMADKPEGKRRGLATIASAVGLAFWLASLVWGIVSLAFYRSSERHGPDMVGDEVSHFLVPIIVSLVIACAILVAPWDHPRPIQAHRYAPLAVSFLAGIVSVVAYWCCVLR
jgi:hypothetical protein